MSQGLKANNLPSAQKIIFKAADSNGMHVTKGNIVDQDQKTLCGAQIGSSCKEILRTAVDMGIVDQIDV